MSEDKQAKMEKVLALISEGKSVRQSCEEAGISKAMFLRDVDSDRYARARDACADAQFDEMRELEAACLRGTLDFQAYRAAMDTRKWRLARMRPKTYGDKLDVNHSSEDGTMSPVPVINLGGLPTQERNTLIQQVFTQDEAGE